MQGSQSTKHAVLIHFVASHFVAFRTLGTSCDICASTSRIGTHWLLPLLCGGANAILLISARSKAGK